MKKKKIIIVNNRLGYYGAENVLTNMANHLDQETYDITVLTLTEGDNSKLADGVKYRYIFSKKKGIWTRGCNKIKYLLDYERLANVYCKGYDIAIAFKMGECSKLVGFSNALKKFCWIHSNVSELDEECSYSFDNIADESHFLERFDSLVAVSKACKESFLKKYTGNYYVRVIYNPIDSVSICNKAEESLTEKEAELFNGEAPVIGTVARIDAQKRIDRLIHISQKLTEEGIMHKLVIVGDGIDYNKFVEEISQKHLDNIYMVGFSSNPYKYVKHFDLFICSSYWESYSIVVNEALVLGVPVISTKCGGPEEILQYGKYGVLVDNDENALYVAVRNFLLGKKAKTKKYCPDNVMKEFLSSVDCLFDCR